MNKLNHLTSGFVVWLQVLYLYKQLMEYYLEKGSTLKHLSGILTFLGVLLKFAAYSDNTKNNPLYIILNQLFMIHMVFGILIQTCIFLKFSFEQLLDRPTFIIIFFTILSYTYGLLVHPILIIKTCLLSIFVVTRK